jgi:polysaccharide export outer membrane protein
MIENKKRFVMRQLTFSVLVLFLSIAPAVAQSSSKAPESKAPEPKAPAGPKSGADASGARGKGPSKPSADPDFVIGSEDVLEIKVWREPDLTTRAVVRPDGKIGVTLLGDVQASGLTTSQLKDEVASKLEHYVEQPEVSVVVAEIHSQMVHLIGAVGRPGSYSLGGPLSIVELLARAGGIAEVAKADQIAIIRKRPGGELERIPFNYREFLEGKNLHGNIQLQNGDVVVVR